MWKRTLIIIFLLFASLQAREYWYGIYLNNNKIGYSTIELNRVKSGYQIREQMVMELKMLGATKRVESITSILTTSSYIPRSMDFTLKTGDQKVEGTVRVEKGEFKITFKTSGGGKIERTLKYSGIPHTSATLKVYLMKKLPQKSEHIALFDPSTATVSDAELELVSVRDTVISGKKEKLYVYSLTYEGVTSHLYVTRNHILKEEGPMGLVQVEEPREVALQRGKKIDLIRLYSVVPSRPIKAEEYLKLKLKNVSPSGLDLSLANQRLIEAGKSYAIVELKKEEIPYENSVLPDSVRKFLEPDGYVQSDAPQIVELASYITEGAQNDAEKVERILNWVYENLEKRPSVTLPTALDVLEMGYGDCNEHAVLFAALARAAGVPAEIVVGLIYQGGAYYYHAWDAVWLGNRWVFVDPIFHEFPASLNHLYLKRGGIDKQTEIIQVVGNLKIEVLGQR